MKTSDIRSQSTISPLHSKRSVIASVLISIFAVAWILFSITFFVGAVYFLIKGSDEPFWLWLVILAIAIFFNALWIYAWKKHKTTAYTHINIDDKGIHYFNARSNTTVKHYRWSDFRKNSQKEFDVERHTTSGFVNNAKVSSDWVLWWSKEGEQVKAHKENFKGGHIFYMIANSKALIGKCLEMLAYHRPDLKIDPLLFSTFFIDKKTFAFERQRYLRTWMMVAVFIIIVLVLIEFYMDYRFGSSPFVDLLFGE